MRTILFVCTGNTCRSPMAEGLFNALAEKNNLPFRGLSCGVSAVEGDAVSKNAVYAAKELGADISCHTARQINQELFDEAEQVYAMTKSQADMLRGIMGSDKIHTLGERDISDPYGGDLQIYRRTAREIQASVERIAGELK